MKLSKNFNLDEMVKSQTANRWGFDEQYNPPDDVINNLMLLCSKVLQPIRDTLKAPIIVTSGYRCPRLNAKIGGAYTVINGKPVQTSQHCYGQAADINFMKDSKEFNGSLVSVIKDLVADPSFQFDQCILEFGSDDNPAWVHISYCEGKNRMQVLRAYKSGKKTLYKPWHL